MANETLRKALGNFADTYPQARESAYKGIDFESLRNEIETIKAGSVEQVEKLSQRFEDAEGDRQKSDQIQAAKAATLYDSTYVKGTRLVGDSWEKEIFKNLLTGGAVIMCITCSFKSSGSSISLSSG